MRIIYVVGLTCAGKSTFINTAVSRFMNVSAVEVGKEFRRRHPPEYFEGKGAMPHTEDEAWEIYEEFVDKAERAQAQVLLVDGQPRMLSQVERCLEFRPGHEHEALWLYADEEVTEKRICDRFAGDSAARDLAVQRRKNDAEQLYHVIWALFDRGVRVVQLDNSTFGGFHSEMMADYILKGAADVRSTR